MILLFDFDGTLCDSVDQAIDAANEALSRFNRPLLTKVEIKNKGFRQIIKKRKVNRLQLLFAIYYYRRHLSKMIDTMDSFPGLNNILKKLSQEHTLGIITSNSKQNVLAFLGRHGIKNCFTIIESEFSYFGKHRKISNISKPISIDKNIIFYIGDEARDVVAAKKAGVKSVAVTWGFEGKEVLKKSHPDIIINKPIELLNLAK